MDEKDLMRFIYRIMTCRNQKLIRTSLQELKDILIQENADRALIETVAKAMDASVDIEKYIAEKNKVTLTRAEMESVINKRKARFEPAQRPSTYIDTGCRCGSGVY